MAGSLTSMPSPTRPPLPVLTTLTPELAGPWGAESMGKGQGPRVCGWDWPT